MPRGKNAGAGEPGGRRPGSRGASTRSMRELGKELGTSADWQAHQVRLERAQGAARSRCRRMTASPSTTISSARCSISAPTSRRQSGMARDPEQVTSTLVGLATGRMPEVREPRRHRARPRHLRRAARLPERRRPRHHRHGAPGSDGACSARSSASSTPSTTTRPKCAPRSRPPSRRRAMPSPRYSAFVEQKLLKAQEVTVKGTGDVRRRGARHRRRSPRSRMPRMT